MIKIAYVINYIVKNGPSNVVLNIINNLDKTKYDISLITLFEGNDSEVIMHLRNNGINVYECNSLSRIKCLFNQNKEFEEIVEQGKFDILHTHGFIPDILSSRLEDSIKKITTIHNNMYEDYLDTYGIMKSRIFIYIHLSALRRLDECVCCSKSVYDVLKNKLNNTSYIRNGIEPIKNDLNVAREELNIPENARVFIYAGVLNSRKNIVWLIEKFTHYHNEDEYLLVLGSGEKEEECRQKSNEHVKILGFQANPVAYMNIGDIYISASKSEGFSIAVLEALACGLGLFLSDIPSHGEIIGMGGDVYLGETFDQSNFKEKLDRIRKKNLIKKTIKQFQIENLSAVSMAKQYETTYFKIQGE